jgi:hypothetical protein
MLGRHIIKIGREKFEIEPLCIFARSGGFRNVVDLHNKLHLEDIKRVLCCKAGIYAFDDQFSRG